MVTVLIAGANIITGGLKVTVIRLADQKWNGYENCVRAM